jgi:hypothetical protein
MIVSDMNSWRACITHQHPALPKTAEGARGVVHALERHGSKDRIAVGEAVPVVVPSRAWSELGARLWTERVVVLDVAPPFPS